MNGAAGGHWPAGRTRRANERPIVDVFRAPVLETTAANPGRDQRNCNRLREPDDAAACTGQTSVNKIPEEEPARAGPANVLTRGRSENKALMKPPV